MTACCPTNANARSRAIAWMFAAKSTVEPVIVEAEAAFLLETREELVRSNASRCSRAASGPLGQLSNRLGDQDWLDGEFSAGDLVMINVLRRPTARNMLGEFPRLDAYVARGEARPAFKRAYDAQHEVFVAASGEPIAL